jgi:hypothetical protein
MPLLPDLKKVLSKQKYYKIERRLRVWYSSLFELYAMDGESYVVINF